MSMQMISANDQNVFGLGTTGGNQLVLAPFATSTLDFDVPEQAYPQLVIPSQTSPDLDNTEHIILAHNATNGLLTVDKGTLVIDVATGPVSIPDGITSTGQLNITGAGNNNFTGPLLGLSDVRVGAAAALYWTGRGGVRSSAASVFQLGNVGGTTGTTFDMSTDGTFKLLPIAGTATATATFQQSIGAKGALRTITGAEQTLTCDGGGSATLVTSGLIPDGAMGVAVTTRTTTALTGSTGYSIGDGSDADLYGVQSVATISATTTMADATANVPWNMLSAGEVTITFAGGNCTAGAVLVTASYTSMSAATSN
jgi:hypothetical protein